MMDKTDVESADQTHGISNPGYIDDNTDIKETHGEIVETKSGHSNKSSCCRSPSRKCIAAFFKKYFLEGQKLRKPVKTTESGLPWWKKVINSKKFWAILMPFVFWEVIWWSLAVRHDYFQYFPDKYKMSITMMFGATVAGMTSEGGGAVAFPVMTLALNVAPSVARDFSLMIQSCGMTAAAFTIYWMGVKVEKHSLLFCSIGALFGMILGLEVLDTLPAITPPIKKLGFVSIFGSFSFALFLVNREHKRKTFDSIPNFGIWEALVLLVTGFVGGIFSAFAGSGVDICSFSIICLLFRISEKVATPTSVVLMGINTCVGFYWRELMQDGAEQEAWEYLAVCVPIVVFFAPMGSLIASHFHRQVLASLVYCLDIIALVTALIVIDMLPNGDPSRIILVVGFLVGGFVLFGIISLIGRKYEKVMTEKMLKKENKVEVKMLKDSEEVNIENLESNQ